MLPSDGDDMGHMGHYHYGLHHSEDGLKRGKGEIVHMTHIIWQNGLLSNYGVPDMAFVK
jgi:hypothetical protein